MKTIFILSFAVLITNLSFAQNNIGIGTVTPNSSAALDITSTNKGLLIPRMTTAQRTAIISPAKGLMVFDNDLNSFYFYNGTIWSSVSAAGTLALPYSNSVNSGISAFKIVNDGMGSALDGSSNADYGIGISAAAKGITGWGLFSYAKRSTGIAIKALADSGTALEASNSYVFTANPLVKLTNKGLTNAISIISDNTANYNPAIKVDYKSNNNGAGIESIATGLATSSFNAVNMSENGVGFRSTTGDGWSVFVNNNSNNKATVYAYNSGNAPGVLGSNVGNGAGLKGETYGIGGVGVHGEVVASGAQGNAGLFENNNANNHQAVIEVYNKGLGEGLLIANSNINSVYSMFRVFKNTSTVARIDGTGKGFFNGGTQNSGADVAEAFDVKNNINNYEPGDVLVISTDADRTVEKSAMPYSTLVAGVYATKPGVLLTEENTESDLSGKVPMGVIGVIPTKVCGEGGNIKRGDMLVTSSLHGVAMKADPALIKTGQVIGKALQDYSDLNNISIIKVLVSVK